MLDQLLIKIIDAGLQGRGEGLVHDPATDAGADLGQFRHVLHVEVIELGLDALVQPILGEKLAVGLRGGGEASRDLHADFRQVMDHLAQRGVLAAHNGHVVHAKIAKPADIVGHGESPLGYCW